VTRLLLGGLAALLAASCQVAIPGVQQAADRLVVPAEDRVLADVQKQHDETAVRERLVRHQRAVQRTGLAWLRGGTMPDHRLLVFYGNPLSPVLGPIGQSDDTELVARIRRQAALYQQLDPTRPVMPAFDYVDPVAQPDPQKDGSYTYRMPAESVQHYIDLARANHILFFFDLQVGRSQVAKEIDLLWPFITQPGVNVALDPEFDMAPGDVPGVQFGRMFAADINAVADRLAALNTEDAVAPKLLLVHQFRDDLLPDRANIVATGRSGVQVILCTDGVGAPEPKIGGYGKFNRPGIPGAFPGIKLFYDQDKPLMSEKDVMALDPQPLLVMYQ
jgi:hypothetical protein